jgi:hypothetical protein
MLAYRTRGAVWAHEKVKVMTVSYVLNVPLPETKIARAVHAARAIFSRPSYSA